MGETVTAMSSCNVTVVEPLTVESATLIAVMVTVGVAGRIAGAVYVAEPSPIATIVPVAAFPPTTPFTAHATPIAGLPDPVTVAVNVCAAPSRTVGEAGETVTAMSSCNVTVAVALALGSAALTAVIVTVLVDGRIVGAVYSPLAEIVPIVEFPPATPFPVHVTLPFELPVTVAWNCCVCPRNSVALAGCTVTLTLGGGGGGGAVPPPLCPVLPAHAASIAATQNPATSAKWYAPNCFALPGCPEAPRINVLGWQLVFMRQT